MENSFKRKSWEKIKIKIKIKLWYGKRWWEGKEVSGKKSEETMKKSFKLGKSYEIETDTKNSLDKMKKNWEMETIKEKGERRKRAQKEWKKKNR